MILLERSSVELSASAKGTAAVMTPPTGSATPSPWASRRVASRRRSARPCGVERIRISGGGSAHGCEVKPPLVHVETRFPRPRAPRSPGTHPGRPAHPPRLRPRPASPWRASGRRRPPAYVPRRGRSPAGPGRVVPSNVTSDHPASSHSLRPPERDPGVVVGHTAPRSPSVRSGCAHTQSAVETVVSGPIDRREGNGDDTTVRLSRVHSTSPASDATVSVPASVVVRMTSARARRERRHVSITRPLLPSIRRRSARPPSTPGRTPPFPRPKGGPGTLPRAVSFVPEDASPQR